MTHILIVEDNTSLAEGLRDNLELEGFVVTIAESGRAALVEARRLTPDLIILDLMLPELDGYHVLRALREQGVDTPILILTARGEEADKVRGFRIGADDYVTKPFGLMELIARVYALLRRARGAVAGRQSPLPPCVRFGDVEVYPGRRMVLRGGQQVELRPKEFDLLVALIAQDGNAITRKDLLVQVWGYDAGTASRTVDTHIGELRRKLEKDPTSPQHILTVRKSGYRFQV
ncbi:MAG: response regulator transcription factor [Gemmatimonadaceae bacterium]|nr:response regulator transcription factor [Gemmatimonadaceae bacterium]